MYGWFWVCSLAAGVEVGFRVLGLGSEVGGSPALFCFCPAAGFPCPALWDDDGGGGGCDDVEVGDDTLFDAEPSVTSFAVCCIAANPGDVDCVHPAAVEVFSDGDARAVDDEWSLFDGRDSDTAGDVHTISDTGLLELDFACEAVCAVGGSLWFLGGAFGDVLLAASLEFAFCWCGCWCGCWWGCWWGCWCGGGGSVRDSEPSWPFNVPVPGCLLSTLC